MAKLLFWIVVTPLAVAVVVFSVNNRNGVVLDLWPLGPLDFAADPVPLFAVVLAALLAGFLAGGFVAWVSAGKVRKRARAESRRADGAEGELAEAKNSIQQLQSEADNAREETLRLPADAA